MINISDLIGKPFKNGGRGPDEYDCFGLVREVYHRLGIELPLYLIDCYDEEKICNAFSLSNVIKLDIPKIYSIIAMRNGVPFVNHFGVYLGNREFIHTLKGTGVCKASIDHIFWKRAIEGYYQWNP